MKKLFVLLLFCASCTNETHDANKVAQGLVYFRDIRTGLCFAGWRLEYQHGLMTNVPCTPEVLSSLVPSYLKEKS